MKKLFIILLIGFSISTFAQKVSGSKQDVENLIAKNWDVEYALMSGLIIKNLPPKADFEVSFTKEGTFKITKISNEVIEGRWVFNSKTHYVALLKDEAIIGKVSNLQSAKMELILISDKADNLNLSDIKVVLKPL